MDALSSWVERDVLHDLERLRKRSAQHEAKRKEVSISLQHHNDLAEMKEKITALQKKRDQLRKSLQQPPRTVKDLIEEGKQGDGNAEQSLEELQRKKLMDLQFAYRLTGYSLTVVDKNKVRLCFDTSYKGEFCEPYYVELRIVGEVMTVTRHTLPPFVPLESLKAKLSNIREFAKSVRDYLLAFVSRRQACVHVQKVYASNFAGEVSMSAACNHIDFILARFGAGTDLPEEEQGPLELQLIYGDLLQTVPSKIRLGLICMDETSSEDESTAYLDPTPQQLAVLKKYKQWLKNLEFPDAMQKMCET